MGPTLKQPCYDSSGVTGSNTRFTVSSLPGRGSPTLILKYFLLSLLLGSRSRSYIFHSNWQGFGEVLTSLSCFWIGGTEVTVDPRLSVG